MSLYEYFMKNGPNRKKRNGKAKAKVGVCLPPKQNTKPATKLLLDLLSTNTNLLSITPFSKLFLFNHHNKKTSYKYIYDYYTT